MSNHLRALVLFVYLCDMEHESAVNPQINKRFWWKC